MLDAAEAFLHMSLPLTAAVGIHPDDDQTAVNAKIDQAIATLGISGREDVLFLVDLVGSTPARLCCDKCGDRGHVVTGVNMPMLLKLATADRSTPPADLGTTLVLTGTKSIHVE
jgi:mannose/fructose-specific phosphotransferase system component IIA